MALMRLIERWKRVLRSAHSSCRFARRGVVHGRNDLPERSASSAVMRRAAPRMATISSPSMTVNTSSIDSREIGLPWRPRGGCSGPAPPTAGAAAPRGPGWRSPASRRASSSITSRWPGASSQRMIASAQRPIDELLLGAEAASGRARASGSWISRSSTRVFLSIAWLPAMQARAEPIALSGPQRSGAPVRTDGAEPGDLVAVGQHAVDAPLRAARRPWPARGIRHPALRGFASPVPQPLPAAPRSRWPCSPRLRRTGRPRSRRSG